MKNESNIIHVPYLTVCTSQCPRKALPWEWSASAHSFSWRRPGGCRRLPWTFHAFQGHVIMGHHLQVSAYRTCHGSKYTSSFKGDVALLWHNMRGPLGDLYSCNVYISNPRCKCCIPWRRPLLGHFMPLELEGPWVRSHWILGDLVDGECQDHHPTLLLYTRALRARWPLTSIISRWWEMARPFHFTLH